MSDRNSRNSHLTIKKAVRLLKAAGISYREGKDHYTFRPPGWVGTLVIPYKGTGTKKLSSAIHKALRGEVPSKSGRTRGR